MSSDAFQSIWTAANRVALNRVLTTARGQAPSAGSRIDQKVNIDIGSIKSQLSSKLGSVSTALPAANPGSNTSLNVSADLKQSRQRVRQVVRTADYLNSVLPYVIAPPFSALWHWLINAAERSLRSQRLR